MTDDHWSAYAPWTEERDARLLKMRAEGYSYSEIADALRRTTRNACIGRAARIGVPRSEKKAPTRHIEKKNPMPKPKKQTLRNHIVRSGIGMVIVATPEFEPQEVRELPPDQVLVSQRKQLLELKLIVAAGLMAMLEHLDSSSAVRLVVLGLIARSINGLHMLGSLNSSRIGLPRGMRWRESLDRKLTAPLPVTNTNLS